ncbi:MAG: Calx-beta domain-containing protein [Acidimicrobiales bacterium]
MSRRAARSGLRKRFTAMLCSATVLSGGLAGLISPQPAAAADDTSVVVGAAQVQEAWWVANALDRLGTGPDAVKTGFYINTLTNMYAANPSLGSGDATAQLQALRSAVDAQSQKGLAGPQGNQVVADFLPLVKSALTAVGPENGAVIQGARLSYNLLASALTASSMGGDRVTAAADLAVERGVLANKQTDILFGAIGTAHAPGFEQFKSAYDNTFASVTAPVATSTQQLIATNPTLQNVTGLTGLVDANGAMNLTRGQLKAEMATQLGKMQDQFKPLLGDPTLGVEGYMTKITNAQKDPLAYIEDKAARDKFLAEWKKDSAEQVKWLDVGKSGINVLVSLMEATNKDLGIQNDPLPKQVAVVGTAIADMTIAAVKFAGVAVEMGGILNALGSASGAALTGNFIGAALQIVTLFGPKEPSKDKLVLDQIGKLQKQVATLGTQMSSRFDKVDRSLNKIYQDMMREFNQIDVVLGTIRTDLSTIQQSLNQIRDQLTAFEGNLYTTILSAKRSELWDWIDRALGYQPRTGEPLPFTADATNYYDANSKFLTWARTFASSAAATGGSDLRSFADGDIAGELTKFYEPEYADIVSPLSTNVRYLRDLPTAWGLSPLVPDAVPNPLDWYLGARAYHSLNLESPANAGRNLQVQTEIEAIVTAGRKYQNFERAIVDGPRDERGLNPLFRTLLQRYRDKAVQLDGAIAEKIEKPYKVEEKIDPFHPSGVDQPVSDALKTAFPSIPFCNASLSGTRELGPKAVDLVMPARMQLVQNYAKAGTTSVCVTAEWGDSDVFRDGNTYMYRAPLVVRLVSTMTSSAFEGGPVITAEGTTERFVWCTEPVFPEPMGECPEVPDATEEANANWGNVKFALENAQVISVNQPVYDRIRDRGIAFLRSVEAGLYRKIATELGSTVLGASRELDGAKLALESYVRQGMPAALAGDEVLSAMLLGSDGIRDRKHLGTFFLAAAGAPTGTNARITDLAVNNRRADHLTGAVVRYLDLFRAGYSDGSVAVRSTINRLNLLVDLLNTPALNILPVAPEHSFGRVPAGGTKDLTLTVANAGVAKVTLSSPTVDGGGFSLVDQTCGNELAALARCSVKVRFAPTNTAPATGSLKVVNNSLSSPTVGVLSGNTGPGLSVNDVSVAEGNSGTTQATFTITRSGSLAAPSSVVWATADGTATAGSDYVAVAPATVSFAAGEATKTVTVAVNGDTVTEADEQFSVKLSSPSEGTAIDDDTGTATVTNDDGVQPPSTAPSFAINDVSVVEPASGTTDAKFTVTRSGNTTAASSVRWRTVNATAVAPGDYTAVATTTVSFAARETTKTVSVAVRADTLAESDETFLVKLDGPSGATIADDSGTATVVNDKPTVSIGNASVPEGNAGTTQATFTITRGGDRSAAASVQWATANSTATGGSDFVAVPATTVNFAGGEATKTVSVTVNGDTVAEADEMFYVRLSNPTGASLAVAQGAGVIVTDDAP